VRSYFGHIRYVPGVHSYIASIREEALRQAANFKIQCTAAEILKVSMRTLWYEYKDVLDNIGSKLLMAVHDELLLMVKDNPEARQITDSIVTAAMTNPILMEGVEVGTTGIYKYNWAELK
jgi:DNA polymerase I-like protein with 3'-5' exonuclease and polymerase domains